MTRAMHRHEVPVDDKPHSFSLVVGNEIARVEVTSRPDMVEFWVEHEDDRTMSTRWFKVFGTGQPLPEDGRWVGTTSRHSSSMSSIGLSGGGLVWHLFEVVRPEGTS